MKIFKLFVGLLKDVVKVQETRVKSFTEGELEQRQWDLYEAIEEKKRIQKQKQLMQRLEVIQTGSTKNHYVECEFRDFKKRTDYFKPLFARETRVDLDEKPNELTEKKNNLKTVCKLFKRDDGKY